MTENEATLHIELEDSGDLLVRVRARHAVLPKRQRPLRFVGRADGEKRYASARLPVPRTLGTVPPPESWVPEMTQSLVELRREIEDDGWVISSHGNQPWDLHYQRRDTAQRWRGNDPGSVAVGPDAAMQTPTGTSRTGAPLHGPGVPQPGPPQPWTVGRVVALVVGEMLGRRWRPPGRWSPRPWT